jgi:hypothetical protein
MSYCQPVTYSLDPRTSFTYRPNTFLNAPGRWLDTYVSFPRPDYYRYWERLTGSDRYSARDFGAWFQHAPDDRRPSLSLVNAAGITRILGSSACEKPAFAPWQRLASIPARPTSRTDTAYANPAAYPTAYVSHRWQAVESPDEAVRRLAAPANARFDTHVDYAEDVSRSASAGSPVAARLERRSATLLRVRVPPLERPGLLVVLDLYDTHWRAYVDGRRSPLVRVNGVFRGVEVARDAQNVELRYEPWWPRWLFPLCWVVIGAALVLVAAAAARGVRRTLSRGVPDDASTESSAARARRR